MNSDDNHDNNTHTYEIWIDLENEVLHLGLPLSLTSEKFSHKELHVFSLSLLDAEHIARQLLHNIEELR